MGGCFSEREGPGPGFKLHRLFHLDLLSRTLFRFDATIQVDAALNVKEQGKGGEGRRIGGGGGGAL